MSPDELLATDVLLLPLLPLDELWDALPPPVAPVTTSLPHDAVAAALARIVTASTLGTVSGLFGFFVSIIGRA